MRYYSLHGNSEMASFQEAVVRGIAPDKGLYFPERIPRLEEGFWKDIEKYSKIELAQRMIEPFIEQEIPTARLTSILEDTLNFDFPLVEIEKDTYALELFHGPTMAFKDVGGRFMARCLGYFNRDNNREVTVLVATSGDTGGAVASGFLGVKGVNVVILYPSGKVSEVQEKQLTTLGQNIRALEVEGTFDDCQAMVKSAFLDKEITGKMQLTSANSINVARWLPQMFYYAFAYQNLSKQTQSPVFSTPSGNFGNICAGMMAYKLGLPVEHFVASTNRNRVVPDYMENGVYTPRASVSTISNAMDVGDPSNFIRIQKLFGEDFDALQQVLSSYSFDDVQTRQTMKAVYDKTGYVLDPHGAVGYLGLRKYQEDAQQKAESNSPNSLGVFLETAHPVKFLDVVEPVIGKKVEIPEQIAAVMHGKKIAVGISNYDQLKDFLLNFR